MIYGSTSLLGVFLIFIYNFLLDYLPPLLLHFPFYLLLGLFLVLFIMSLISFNKRAKANDRLQYIYVKLTKIMNRFTPFSKYVNQIMMTFMTNNEKGKSRFLLIMIFFICAATLSSIHSRYSNIALLKGKTSDNNFFQTNRMYPNFYENQHPQGKEILSPIISSDQISGKFLSVFIPVFRNEKFIRDKICSTYIPDETISDDDNKKRKKEQGVFCYRKYHQIYVNDSLYQVEFIHKNHMNKDEFGIVGYIPTDDFFIGKNLLEVVKIQDEKGAIFQRTEIPFWFEG